VGRIDDVLNVAGHRLGTMEIESALVAHPQIAEAAVVGRPHEIKGEAVFAYVVCRGAKPAEVTALTQELRRWVAEQLSPIAQPDEIRFSDALPKTRSGKIMRRLLRSIARGEEIIEDVSTLENPAIVAQLRGEAQPSQPAAPHATSRRAKAKRPRPPRARATVRKSAGRGGSRRAARASPKRKRSAKAVSKRARRTAATRSASRRGSARRTTAARTQRARKSRSTRARRR
jgi:hypothetical protein